MDKFEENAIPNLVKFLYSSMYYYELKKKDCNIDRVRNKIKLIMNNAITIEEEKNRLDNYDKIKKIDKMMDIIYGILKNSDLQNDISTEKINTEEFFSRYYTQICGLNKRHYCMKDLVDVDLIATGKNGKIIEYEKNKSKTESVFEDKNGLKVKIIPLGVLAFRRDNFIGDYVYKYSIQRELEHGIFANNIVYTEISLCNMNDNEYKKIVLDELLSQDNISLSSCDGYIGCVSDNNAKLNGDLNTREVFDDEGYIYKINNKYSLRYDRYTASAVSLAERLLVMEEKDKDNNIIYLADYKKKENSLEER